MNYLSYAPNGKYSISAIEELLKLDITFSQDEYEIIADSKYANEQMPTEVELIFEYNNKEYRVKRNPEYERTKTRGEGKTIERANAELEFPDKRVITKVSEVTKAITEIIGLDRQQFTQIAMIAQGDFLRLLFASTEERKKIFRRIFGTEKYFNLQENLKS